MIPLPCQPRVLEPSAEVRAMFLEGGSAHGRAFLDDDWFRYLPDGRTEVHEFCGEGCPFHAPYPERIRELAQVCAFRYQSALRELGGGWSVRDLLLDQINTTASELELAARVAGLPRRAPGGGLRQVVDAEDLVRTIAETEPQTDLERYWVDQARRLNGGPYATCFRCGGRLSSPNAVHPCYPSRGEACPACGLTPAQADAGDDLGVALGCPECCPTEHQAPSCGCGNGWSCEVCR